MLAKTFLSENAFEYIFHIGREIKAIINTDEKRPEILATMQKKREIVEQHTKEGSLRLHNVKCAVFNMAA